MRRLRSALQLLALCGVLYACTSNTAPSPTPHGVSPSGRYELFSEINHDKADLRKYFCVRIVVKDRQYHKTLKLQTGASDRMRWDLRWDKGRDEIVLDSGDIGTYRYAIDPTGKIQEISPAP